MIMTIGKDSVVYCQYLDKKIGDASPYLEKQTYRHVDYGTDPHSYLASGGTNYREPALRQAIPTET